MLSHKELIDKNDWDIILLLDAVRFDYFEKYYREVFKDGGTLYKVKSAVTASPPWFFENFSYKNPRKDIIFISMDFEISSEDTHFISFGYRLKYGGMNYSMRNFFGEVVDIWKRGYDKKLGIVRPETVSEEVIKVAKVNPDKKIIANYWCVHDPYIYHLERGMQTIIDMERLGGRGRPEYNRYALRNLKEFSRWFFKDTTIWTLRKKLGIKTVGGLAELWLNHGHDGIIQGYVEDLKLAMKCVKKVYDAFPDKKIVVTSDHGSLLGEKGMYGHGGKKFKELIEVPWFKK